MLQPRFPPSTKNIKGLVLVLNSTLFICTSCITNKKTASSSGVRPGDVHNMLLHCMEMGSMTTGLPRRSYGPVTSCGQRHPTTPVLLNTPQPWVASPETWFSLEVAFIRISYLLDCRNRYVGDVFHSIQIPNPLPLTGGPRLGSKVFMASEEELAESMLAWCDKRESLPCEVMPLQQPTLCLTVLQ